MLCRSYLKNTHYSNYRGLSTRLKHALDYGLYDASNSDYYRAQVDLKKASTILSMRGLFWEALMEDLSIDHTQENQTQSDLTNIHKSIEAIVLAKSAYFKKAELEDRQEVLSFLNAIVSSAEGKFVLFLGGVYYYSLSNSVELTLLGKSTGKTLTLQHLKNHSTNVIYIDGRDVGTLSELLGKAIPNEQQGAVAKLLNHPRVTFGLDSLLSMLSSFPLFGTTKNIINSVFKESTPTQLLGAFLETSNSPPTIIIDEMNKFLCEADNKEKKELGNLLELFVRITKQSHKAKIILASSEHSFPYRLNAISGGNFSGNATKKIFAGEIPPKYMFELLTKKWHMGPILASIFIANYGGHIWNCSLALDELLLGKKDFIARSVLGSTLFSNVDVSLRSKVDGMLGLFENVARDGFAPIVNEKDPRAEIGSQNNIIGVVDPQAVVVGVPLNIREGENFGVVPASQSMRLIIAHMLSTQSYKEL